MSEEKYIKSLIEQQLLQKQIDQLSKRLKEIKRDDYINVFDWWTPSNCHNFEECDGCEDCDMPDEIWEDRKKQLRKIWMEKNEK